MENKTMEKLITRVANGKITSASELEKECKKKGVDYTEALDNIEFYEGIEMCDRCGRFARFEKMFWFDGYDYEQDEADQALLKAVEFKRKKGKYWEKICYDCVELLVKEGYKIMEEENGISKRR